MTGPRPSAHQIARLRAAIAIMAEPRRSVYLYCARDQLEYPQVATRLGLTVHEVEHHLAEALAELRASVARDDGPRS